MNKKLPFAITLLGMIFGVMIAIVFGVNENVFKNHIQQGLTQNQKIQQIKDPIQKEATVKSEAEKNWRYFQRFHFHSTGIGAMSLGALLLLLFVQAPLRGKSIAAYMISIGGFFYPFVWLFAGIYGPEMGRTEAKEAFAIFGYMGGVFLVGLGISLYLLLKYPLQLRFEGDFK